MIVGLCVALALILVPVSWAPTYLFAFGFGRLALGMSLRQSNPIQSLVGSGHKGTVASSAAQTPPRQSNKSHREWSAIYCKNKKIFSNKADHAVSSELIRQYLLSVNKPFRMFVVGVNSGSDVYNLLRHRWFDVSRAEIFGWEANPDVFKQAAQLLSKFTIVKLYNKGVSDHAGEMNMTMIEGSSEVGGLFSSKWSWATKHGWKVKTTTVSVETWSAFLRSVQINFVPYSLIDVEGHEVHVIRGMELEIHADAFPLFQYEVGSTWADERHSQEWTQEEMADYLNGLGYDLYQMGAIGASPRLLPVTSFTIRSVSYGRQNCSWTLAGRSVGMENNVLAVLRRYMQAHPWLDRSVQQWLM